METQYKYYDEAQKIKIVEVAIPELKEKKYTYLMTDDYLALAKELLQFGFNEKFVKADFIPNPRLSPAVQEAMEAAGATYSVTFSHDVHIMNHYVPGMQPEICDLMPFSCRIKTWCPPLLFAVAMMDATRQVEFLLNAHVSLEQEDRHGRTALIAAAQTNALNAGKLLIAHGASVDIRDSYGLTPLTAAVSINALDFASTYLLNKLKRT